MRGVTPLAIWLVALVTLAGCATAAVDEPTPTPVPTAVKPTYSVQRGDVIPQVTFAGKIQPVTTKEAFFLADGSVRKVYVNADELVTAGQLLADLDIIDKLQADLDAAKLAGAAAAQAARNKIRRVQIALEMAQLNVSLARAQNLPADEIKIRELQLELAQMDLDEMNAGLQLDSSSSKVQELETAIENARLTAPMDGRILTSVTPGQRVRARAPVLVVGDPAHLEVLAQTSGDDLQPLSEGMTVTLTLAGSGKQLAGRIRQLPYPYGTGGPQGGDPYVRVALAQNAADGGYKINDAVRVVVTLAYKSGVLWLPPQAIRSVAGRSFVIVQGPNGQQHVGIRVGVQSRERVEILEGLTEGQVVVGP